MGKAKFFEQFNKFLQDPNQCLDPDADQPDPAGTLQVPEITIVGVVPWAYQLGFQDGRLTDTTSEQDGGVRVGPKRDLCAQHAAALGADKATALASYDKGFQAGIQAQTCNPSANVCDEPGKSPGESPGQEVAEELAKFAVAEGVGHAIGHAAGIAAGPIAIVIEAPISARGDPRPATHWWFECSCGNKGLRRCTQEEAQADAAQHRQENSDHEPKIEDDKYEQPWVKCEDPEKKDGGPEPKLSPPPPEKSDGKSIVTGPDGTVIRGYPASDQPQPQGSGTDPGVERSLPDGTVIKGYPPQ